MDSHGKPKGPKGRLFWFVVLCLVCCVVFCCVFVVLYYVLFCLACFGRVWYTSRILRLWQYLKVESDLDLSTMLGVKNLKAPMVFRRKCPPWSHGGGLARNDKAISVFALLIWFDLTSLSLKHMSWLRRTLEQEQKSVYQHPQHLLQEVLQSVLEIHVVLCCSFFCKKKNIVELYISFRILLQDSKPRLRPSCGSGSVWSTRPGLTGHIGVAFVLFGFAYFAYCLMVWYQMLHHFTESDLWENGGKFVWS